MKHNGQMPPVPPPGPDWVMAAIGTITLATLMVAATVGAYATLIASEGGLGSLGSRARLSVAIVLVLALMLFIYLFVVSAGLGTVFTTDDQVRHRRVKIAAVLFYCQVLSIIAFGALITLAAFLDILDSPRVNPASVSPSFWCDVASPADPR